MMRRIALGAAALCCLIVPSAANAQTDFDEKVDQAIERGVRHVWARQRDNGMFSNLNPNSFPKPTGGINTTFPGGAEVLGMCVLAYSGARPESPEVEKSLKVFTKLDLEQTYTLGFRIIALAEFYRHGQNKTKSKLRKAMARDAKRLVEIQLGHGGWHYAKRDSDKFFDFSNTQIAVLALALAVECGVEVPLEAFRKVGQLYVSRQRDDGGWDYGHPQYGNKNSYGSMTAAAVASLFIIRDIVDPKQGCPCRGGRSRSTGNSAADAAMKRGIKWLGDRFSATSNPGWRGGVAYWLYCCQRVGIATGMKYFGTHDWYREGAEALLSRQGRSGGWANWNDTCFALLFLIKGRGPIIMNKLRYDGPWNLHSRDVANLAGYVGKLKEQRINWQVIELVSPLEEMHESPILYITAEGKISLPEDYKAKLRRFTDTGGTVLLEASCGSAGGKGFSERLCRDVWPEWELKRLDEEHPLWTADLKVSGGRPVLYGLGDGVRTFVFYSPRNISCYWHLKAVTRSKNAFYTGNNLYAYATDRGRLRSRTSHRQAGVGKKYAGQQPFCSSVRKQLTMARLKHGGRWNANQHYRPWTALSEDAEKRVGVTVTERDPVEIGQAIPADLSIVYLSGRDLVELSEKTRGHLKTYLAGGGFLLAEATVGDKAFDTSLREALKAAGLALEPLGADSPMITGTFGGDARGYGVTKPGWTAVLRGERIGKPLPPLFGIHLDGKLVGIYSPLDIMYSQTGCRAFGSRGYEAADARALATHLLLLVSTR